MRCPHCDNQHPDNAQFCPVTGMSIDVRGNTSRRQLFLGLGLISLLLMAGSLFMLFGGGGIAGSVADEPAATDTRPSGYQTASVPTERQKTPTERPTALPPTSLPTQTAVPIPSPVESRTNPVDGAEIVLIPAGEFLMGSDPAHDPYFWGAEAPEHTVTLDSFWIYRTEVTQGMYQECDEANACPAPVMINHPVAQQYGNPRFEDYPVIMVTWQSALAYCQWAGGRLPTEAEWEKAARGTDGQMFPWGDDPSADGYANYSSSSPVEVGSHPLGSSPYGVLDMAGNVLEWVNDHFQPLYYEYSPLDNPPGPASGSRRVIRGGAFNHNTIDGLRAAARASLNPEDTKISVGFRCAVDNP